MLLQDSTNGDTSETTSGGWLSSWKKFTVIRTLWDFLRWLLLFTYIYVCVKKIAEMIRDYPMLAEVTQKWSIMMPEVNRSRLHHLPKVTRSFPRAPEVSRKSPIKTECSRLKNKRPQMRIFEINMSYALSINFFLKNKLVKPQIYIRALEGRIIFFFTSIFILCIY